MNQNLLPKSHKIKITFFDVKGGDAIWIRFLGNDEKWHNILVDGGYGNTYKSVFGPLISKITKAEAIDLWIITHPDLDHIGAILGFINDSQVKDKIKVLKQIWFNYSPSIIDATSGKLGVNQGNTLRTFLENHGFVVMQSIANNLPNQDLFGLKIKILSPDLKKLEKLKEHWKHLEQKILKLGRTLKQSDHKKTIEELTLKRFIEDTDPWNGGAIAFMVEFDGVQCLFLSDSHPSSVETSLKNLGFNSDFQANFDLVQLSHHGSKANNSPSLLNLMKASRFVVTGNGINNHHPDKETLTRILTQVQRENDIEFVFPSETDALKNLFSVDIYPFLRWRFKCTFPPNNQGFVEFPFLSLTQT